MGFDRMNSRLPKKKKRGASGGKKSEENGKFGIQLFEKQSHILVKEEGDSIPQTEAGRHQ